MKKLVSLFLAAMLTLALCVSAQAAPVELNLLCWMSEQEAGITAAVDAFNNSQSNIRLNVSYLTRPGQEERLSIALPSGSAPDIIAMNVVHDITYSTKGYLLDIQEMFANGTIDLSQYPASAVESHTVNGVINSVPRDYDCIALYYNKAIFDEAGISYPTDYMAWDEYVDLATKVTNKDKGIYGCNIQAATNTCVYDYILSAGGQVYDENGYCVLNSDIVKTTLQKMCDVIYVNGASATIDEQTELNAKNRFLNSQLAMYQGGSWDLPTLHEALGDNLGLVGIPAMGEKPVSISNSLAWAITYCTKYPEEAKTALAYLASYDSQALTAVSVIPAYKGTDLLWLEKYEKMGASVFIDTINNGYGHGIPYAKVAVNEVNTMVSSLMSEVLATNAVSLLDAGVAAINEVIAANQPK